MYQDQKELYIENQRLKAQLKKELRAGFDFRNTTLKLMFVMFMLGMGCMATVWALVEIGGW